MDYKKISLEKHYEWRGKIEIASRVCLEDSDSLSLAYTPGVAAPCLAIKENTELSYSLTRRHNMIAVVTDGTAVLGLGDIGPEAAMPVMEGKCLLFKEFGDVDAVPLCIRSKDTDEIVKTISLLAGSFGGINLEDISAPRCFEIERRLKEILDIPVFHDDQHGTAVVVLAGLINALKFTKKCAESARVVISGAGAAGAAIAFLLLRAGFTDITMLNSKGIITGDKEYSSQDITKLSKLTNKRNISGGLKEAVKDADVFIGVSAPNILTQEMVSSMNNKSIVFAMANPDPEILPSLAKTAGASVVATGRSDFPNQINNVLAFPGIFRGGLDARVKCFTQEMLIAAAKALAELVSAEELNENYIIPSPFDKRAANAVAEAVKRSQ
jgi:malate dehydrogenase (oxaloacetate-decarboxylating)